MVGRRVRRTRRIAGDRLRRLGQQVEPFVRSKEEPLESLIVIGTSAGGHHALEQMVKGLPPDLPAAVIISTHSQKRPGGDFSLEEFLGRFTNIPLQAVRDAERLHAGRIYVTPPGYATFLDERTLRLEPMKPAFPVTAINRLFESAAKAYGDRIIGVVLTGFLRDGTEGLRAVHDAGGLTIVQDPAEAEYPDMPQNAMHDLPVTFCLRLAEIGPALDLLARRDTAFESGLSTSVRMLKERVALFGRLLTQSTRNLSTQDFLRTQLAALKEDLHTTQSLLTEALALAKKGD